jgi:hypothetical protein
MVLFCFSNLSVPDLLIFLKDIPLMMGSTLNEMMPTFYGEKDLTMEQAKERLAKEYGKIPTNTLSFSQRLIPIIRLRTCFRLIKFSGHIPFVPPMQGLQKQVPHCMFISWHGKVVLTMHRKVLFMDWTFLWHSTPLTLGPIGQAIPKKPGKWPTK